MQFAGSAVARITRSGLYLHSRRVGHACSINIFSSQTWESQLCFPVPGDVLQQHYEIVCGDKSRWDIKRTAHMSASGVTVGTVCHYWYLFLDKRLPGRSMSIVFKKVLVDQILFSPVIITLFFVTLGVLERSTSQKVAAEIVQKGWQLYAVEWFVWPPAQVINFYLLPTRFRVLYDNTISLGFDVFTSYVKHEVPLKECALIEKTSLDIENSEKETH